MTTSKPPPQREPCATLSSDGSISLGEARLWLTPLPTSHRSFVISTWVRSQASSLVKSGVGTLFRKADLDSFFRDYPLYVERFVDQHPTFSLQYEGGAGCHGFLAVRPGIRQLHYVYVPKKLRRIGLAKAMVSSILPGAERIEAVNFWPRTWPANWVYNPYGVRL